MAESVQLHAMVTFTNGKTAGHTLGRRFNSSGLCGLGEDTGCTLVGNRIPLIHPADRVLAESSVLFIANSIHHSVWTCIASDLVDMC
jgi:hypothetical protein